MIRRFGRFVLWRLSESGTKVRALTLYTPRIIIDVTTYSYDRPSKWFEVDLHKHEFAWAVFGVHVYRWGFGISLIRGVKTG